MKLSRLALLVWAKFASSSFTKLEGNGTCVDSNGKWHKWFSISDSQSTGSENNDDALAWCSTATSFLSKLVGVVIQKEDWSGNPSNIWYCLYGDTTDIGLTAFNPPATQSCSDFSGCISNTGCGAVSKIFPANQALCYRHNVSI